VRSRRLRLRLRLGRGLCLRLWLWLRDFRGFKKVLGLSYWTIELGLTQILALSTLSITSILYYNIMGMATMVHISNQDAGIHVGAINAQGLRAQGQIVRFCQRIQEPELLNCLLASVSRGKGNYTIISPTYPTIYKVSQRCEMENKKVREKKESISTTPRLSFTFTRVLLLVDNIN
jgi:hypothetical protein